MASGTDGPIRRERFGFRSISGEDATEQNTS
jgi:hypothetical protein